MKTNKKETRKNDSISYVGPEAHGLTEGLTNLEYFAGLVLQGLSANPEWADTSPKHTAQFAVKQAAYLIEALNEVKE